MPGHAPHLCPRCGSPMTARLRCTSCLDRLSYERPARERERATDPLQHAIESVLPWVRGQRGLYSRA